MKKKYSGLVCLSLLILLILAGCGAVTSTAPLTSNSVAHTSLSQNDEQQAQFPTPSVTPSMSIPSQKATPTPTPALPLLPLQQGPSTPAPTATQACVTYSNETTLVPPKNGTLAAPYGSAPVSQESQQLTQQLFQLVNSDRAACGLPAFAWNATLASGALLHSWNMAHCGFSHTCPDGSTPYQRIANEGFAGLSDCGENIGEAGPYPTPWGGVSTIQESMAHEPLGGWHRIHLFSTTLHSMGIGVYVDSGGSIWFTEDMVS